ncbi:hypothetical protein ABT186_28730 [Streptomyces sp. NPDC001634]|uniref:hypothetical protein n=1 Tax=Streptomyces sp. NPDC001634 TaxID=3154390 RepID=UPI0033314F8A
MFGPAASYSTMPRLLAELDGKTLMRIVKVRRRVLWHVWMLLAQAPRAGVGDLADTGRRRPSGLPGRELTYLNARDGWPKGMRLIVRRGKTIWAEQPLPDGPSRRAGQPTGNRGPGPDTRGFADQTLEEPLAM